MLKGIPSILSPSLLKVLCEMGHGDEIVLGDGNFPAETCGKRVVRYDGYNIPELLRAILTVFPLDTYVDKPVTIMEIVPGDTVVPIIWDEYKRILAEHDDRQGLIRCVERFQFYEAAKNAYAVIATGEKATYANLILKKGVVMYQ